MEQNSQISKVELSKEQLGFLMALFDAWEEKCKECVPSKFHDEIFCEKCHFGLRGDNFSLFFKKLKKRH